MGELAANSARAYRSDWADFERWCADREQPALPASPATVAAYLDARRARLRPATIRRRAAAIGRVHRDAGHRSPSGDAAVRLVLARAEWSEHERDPRTVPLGPREVEAMTRVLPATRAGARDRALLLVGYGAGLRRSEVVALDIRDLRVRDGMLEVSARDRVVRIPPGSTPDLCAVTAWQTWRAYLPRAGPVFRPVHRSDRVASTRLSDRAVTSIVKRAASGAGLDPSRYGGQSLRAGLLVTASRVGATEALIMAQSGHRSRRQVRRTIRPTV
jgi:site-specific recombinase XerD